MQRDSEPSILLRGLSRAALHGVSGSCHNAIESHLCLDNLTTVFRKR